MSMSLLLVFVALSVFGVGSLLFAIVATGRRKRHLLRGIGALAGGLVAAIAAVILDPAFQAGQAARRSERAAIAAAEAEARAAAALAETERKTAAQAEAAAKRAAEEEAAAIAAAAREAEADRAAAEAEAACRADAACWGERVMIPATIACKDAVERLGEFSARWTDGVLEPKFPRVVWADQEAGTLAFGGDAIEFQNAFGAWRPHKYVCKFDPATRTVLGAGAEPGRF